MHSAHHVGGSTDPFAFQTEKQPHHIWHANAMPYKVPPSPTPPLQYCPHLEVVVLSSGMISAGEGLVVCIVSSCHDTTIRNITRSKVILV
jgi:hypothetical protein